MIEFTFSAFKVHRVPLSPLLTPLRLCLLLLSLCLATLLLSRNLAWRQVGRKGEEGEEGEGDLSEKKCPV